MAVTRPETGTPVLRALRSTMQGSSCTERTARGNIAPHRIRRALSAAPAATARVRRHQRGRGQPGSYRGVAGRSSALAREHLAAYVRAATPWSILPVAVAAVGTRRQRRADVSPMNARSEQRSSRPQFTNVPITACSPPRGVTLHCASRRCGRSPSSPRTRAGTARKMKPPRARRHWGGLGHGNRRVSIDTQYDHDPSPLHRRVDQQFFRSSTFSATLSAPGGSYYGAPCPSCVVYGLHVLALQCTPYVERPGDERDSVPHYVGQAGPTYRDRTHSSLHDLASRLDVSQRPTPRCRQLHRRPREADLTRLRPRR